MKTIILLIILFQSTMTFAQGITLLGNYGKKRLYSIVELEKTIETHEIVLFNQQKKGTETYRAFKASTLLNFMLEGEDAPMAFQLITKNGYRPNIDRTLIFDDNAYFAYKVLESNVNDNHFDVFPLYLVWINQEDNDSKSELPWVYQIEKIKYINNQQVKSVASSTPPEVVRGQELYTDHCLPCHHQTGYSHDLLTPNILVKKDEKWVYQYILNPKDFNTRSKMPPYEKVFQNAQDTRYVLEYIKYKFRETK